LSAPDTCVITKNSADQDSRVAIDLAVHTPCAGEEVPSLVRRVEPFSV
jgi:hypothetical protein